MNNKKYIPVIGLEVHVELKTKSKMFCGCSADHFGKEPNAQVCPICLGFPGALPVPNKKAIEWCVMIGLALNCKIPLFSKFDRKNYFYPDLPKGYQISQYDEPFCENGWIDLYSSKVILGSEATPESPSSLARMTKKRIRIQRVHMEEDTAKLVHEFGTQNSKLKAQKYEGYSLIDFNRSGVPLVEIVTEPDFESATEVVEYLKKLQQIVRYLRVSDADMEKGEMRLEPNISLMMNDKGLRIKKKLPNYKVEVKNINSFRFVERTINYEIERQRKLLLKGKTPVQETRGWDEKKQITVSQRIKEEAMDYRYFPEPDIPPIRWAQSQISNLKSQIPELPDQKFKRFKRDYNLSNYDTEILTREKEKADYFEEAVKANNELRIRNREHTDSKTIANWIINKKINLNTFTPALLISGILSQPKYKNITDKEMEKIILQIFKENKNAVNQYKQGKTNAIMFLVGQVIRNAVFKLDPKIVKEKIEKMLQ